jgi:hypothetical protein
MQLCATPIGFALAFGIGYLWFRFTSVSLSITIKPEDMSTVALMCRLGLPLLVVVHEFIHASVHPLGGRSNASVIGFWPSRVLFYGHYTGALSRERFLAILLAPFLVLSVLPLLVALTGALPPGLAGSTLAWCSTLNALFACGDLFGAALVAAQIPRGRLRSKRRVENILEAVSISDLRGPMCKSN